MEGLVRRLYELAVPDDLSAKILVEGIKHPFPVVAAVVLLPPAAEDVSRGILRRHGEEALEAVEVVRGHFLCCSFHLRPEASQVEVVKKAPSLLVF